MSAGRKHISDKKDWNTPPKYIKLIKEFFGNIDLDPRSNEFSMVGAKTNYILPTNGLYEDWNYKRIFVNRLIFIIQSYTFLQKKKNK